MALVHGGGNRFVIDWVENQERQEMRVLRGPKPDLLSLTAVERNELERVVRRRGKDC